MSVTIYAIVIICHCLTNYRVYKHVMFRYWIWLYRNHQVSLGKIVLPYYIWRHFPKILLKIISFPQSILSHCWIKAVILKNCFFREIYILRLVHLVYSYQNVCAVLNLQNDHILSKRSLYNWMVESRNTFFD